MSETRGETWKRVAIEGGVIVASILLAFALDSAWEARGDRRDAGEARRQLLIEFEGVGVELEVYLAQERRVALAASSIHHEAVTALREGRSSIVLPDTTVALLKLAGTFDPAMSALRGLEGGGRMALLEDEELKDRLLEWPTLLADVTEQQRENRALVLEHLAPGLAEVTDPAPVDLRYMELLADLDFEDRSEPVRLEITRRFLATLGTRMTNSALTVLELEELRGIIVEIRTLLADR